MITIEKKYQHWSKDGIIWTEWFAYNSYDTREEAEKALPIIKKKTLTVGKLKSEFRIV